MKPQFLITNGENEMALEGKNPPRMTLILRKIFLFISITLGNNSTNNNLFINNFFNYFSHKFIYGVYLLTH